MKKNILLTGPPGSGKTTVITTIVSLLGKERAAGFYTREVRRKGQRTGFVIVTFSGKEALLASTEVPSSFRVGRYFVFPENLAGALAELEEALSGKTKKCLVIDEIGKMELLSPLFRRSVLAALASNFPVLATILARPHPFCDVIKKREDVEVFFVTPKNREVLPHMLAKAIEQLLGHR